MTFLGKIFTVLIMIMSVLFMGLAMVVFATHTNWKKVVDNPQASANAPLGLKQQLQQSTASKLTSRKTAGWPVNRRLFSRK